MFTVDLPPIDATLVTIIESAAPAAAAGAIRIGAIEIAGRKLELYNQTLAEVSAETRSLAAETIAAAARHVLDSARQGTHPFVADCLALVPGLLGMAADEDWCLSLAQRERVRTLIGYVSETNDLIPDAEPAIGLLDDAILIHRFRGDFAAELADYADFTAFRATEAALRGVPVPDCHVSRRDWLEARSAQSARARRVARSGGPRYAADPGERRFRIG